MMAEPLDLAAAPPRLLRDTAAWLVWRLKPDEAKPGRMRKVPYYTDNGVRWGGHGSARDRAKLVKFDQAVAAARRLKADGVGFATLDGAVTALDFDHCVDAAGNVHGEVLDAIAGTYAELSPSGTGVRAFVLGNLGNRKRHAGDGAAYGVETFATKGFVTFTGQVLEDCALSGCDGLVAQPSAGLHQLLERRLGAPRDGAPDAEPSLSLDQVRECLEAITPPAGYDDWLRLMMAVHFETGGSDEGLELVDQWSERGVGYAGCELIESKWEGFGRTNAATVTGGTLLKAARDAGATVGAVADAGDFEVIPGPARGRFPIQSLGEFAADNQPLTWLIKGVIPRADTIVLFGESGSGKTFLMLDMVAAIARGIEWGGKRVTQGRVLYLVAEGVRGFRQRVRAYCHQAGVLERDLPIDVMHEVTPNLLDAGQVKDLCKELAVRQPYDLVVVDTFAQVTPGANENSGEDMGAALARCRAIGRAAGQAPVVLVHHSGKDASKGSRGWSGIKGAADAELEVTRFDEARALTVTKQKDGQDGEQIGFKLHTVVLGEDEDGDDITSCVVELGQVVQRRSRQRPDKLGKNERIVLGRLHEFAGFAPGGRVSQVELVAASVAQMARDPSKRDQRANLARQAIESLALKQQLTMGEDQNGGFVRVWNEEE